MQWSGILRLEAVIANLLDHLFKTPGDLPGRFSDRFLPATDPRELIAAGSIETGSPARFRLEGFRFRQEFILQLDLPLQFSRLFAFPGQQARPEFLVRDDADDIDAGATDSRTGHIV